MSDSEETGFDKEAEREKLRAQLAEEERGRESTQRMSELLLKGATMTNKHCDVCGDPIFRYDDQEFCPTCQRPVAEAEEADRGSDRGAEPEPDPADPGSVLDDTGGPEADQPREEGSTAAPVDHAVAASPSETGGEPAGRSGGRVRAEDDLHPARSALVGKITTLAEDAAATADLDRARDLLAAVEEAAEALETLEAARRRR